MLKDGDIVGGKYKILTMIGKGGMSRVYLALDQNLNKQWAIKEIEKKARDRNNHVVIQSAIAEVNMMKRLDHPNLPRIVNILDEKDQLYVIMDYVEGISLDRVVKEGGPQPQEDVIDWAMQLCDVLRYLHSQEPAIIYRDMKPANVMLQPNGQIKLIDFGIAREYKEQNIADTTALGTKGYAAPEQFGGHGQTDGRTDIYCLGTTLYHLLTGHSPAEPPYEMYPIRHWNPSLSGGLERIILKCTQLNPEDRYQTCEELDYALQNYEKVDEAYRIRLKSDLKKFIASSAVAVAALAVGIGSLLARNAVNNNDYQVNIARAEKASNAEEKVKLYQTAIDILPNKTDAYEGLLDAYLSDQSFSEEDEAEFQRYVQAHIDELRKQDEYGELAYQIGRAYWFLYDYGSSDSKGDNQATRMKSAKPWFDDAVTYKTKDANHLAAAKAYSEIGSFVNEITLKIDEADDSGEYKKYFSSLESLVDTVSKSKNEGEMVQAQVYQMTMNAMQTYARKFRSDDIKQSDIEKLYKEVYTNVEKMETTSDTSAQMKSDILNRSSLVEETIQNAYTNNGEEA